MIADFFTKPLQGVAFNKARSVIMNLETREWSKLIPTLTFTTDITSNFTRGCYAMRRIMSKCIKHTCLS
jgi:hypothetical protein